MVSCVCRKQLVLRGNTMYRILAAVVILFAIVGTTHAESRQANLTIYNDAIIVLQLNDTDYICSESDVAALHEGTVTVEQDTFTQDNVTHKINKIECTNDMLTRIPAVTTEEIESTWQRTTLEVLESRENGWYIATLDGNTIAMHNAYDLVATSGDVYTNGTYVAIFNTVEYDLWYTESYQMPQQDVVYTVALPIVSAP